ncbi:SAM-dependent methyltransferase [Okibacterium sp. HSC-33S16]|uniref:class I SAM-dependent methyltransferase n=1 Tax=Okibacterium sp. HSC-33S16 TaxID=2910965 RepID=UPI00209F9298|nr:class I SAM-dependent methyltransferase [Okibacterium sp. HSC-33S16]MCP2030337.1 SAM-dependent methyltransferase [Okibacterium sp. HSC-33S16]
MRDRSRLTAHAQSFGQAAETYAKARPSYPAQAVDWLVPEGASRVLDLGAGTGKLTEVLVARGLDVVAIDPSGQMLDELSKRLPAVEAIVGTAELLPLPDASVDAVTVAQAWHWIDAQAAVPEIARVLRPGGALGLVWNTRDESVDWVAELGEIMGGTAHYDLEDGEPTIGPPFGATERWQTTWTQTLNRDELLDLVRSRSYVLVTSDAEQRATLAAVTELIERHPALRGSENVELPYLTECYRARLPEDGRVR